tara:strand:- start:5526 stop:5969 length:444 start_codon:yes stop_codon:yes gene_type:complete
MSDKFLKLDKEVMKFFWDDLAPLFNKVIERQGYGRDSLELVATKIAEDILEVWVSKDEDSKIQAAYCTSIIDYPDKRSLFWGYMSAKDNKLNEWKDKMVISVVRYAEDTDCKTIEFFSNRKGWSKIFRRHNINFKPVGVLYEVDLYE